MYNFNHEYIYLFNHGKIVNSSYNNNIQVNKHKIKYSHILSRVLCGVSLHYNLLSLFIEFSPSLPLSASSNKTSRFPAQCSPVHLPSSPRQR